VTLIAALGAIAAIVFAAAVTRPFEGVAIGSDTQSSVLYFQRLASGAQLERFLGTTPKPLLTVVDGSLRFLTGDWRPIAWLALVVYGAAVAATTVLVGRLVGPVGAAFAAVGLVVSPQLFLDAALAYAVSWALLWLAVAGLAATAARPSWAVAGLALAAGALSRQEVFLVIGVTVLIVAWQFIVQRRSGRGGLPATAPVVLALLALPLCLLHDLLLTGDPLYFLSVPALGAEGRDVATVGEAIRRLVAELRLQPALVLLALVGGLTLLRARAWPLTIGLAVMGPGMAAFFVWVSARGYVSLERYLAPLDLAIVVAAAVGAGAIASAAASRMDPGLSSSAAARGLVLLVAAAVPVVLGPGIGQTDPDNRHVIDTARSGAIDWETLRQDVVEAVAAEPDLRVRVPPDDATSRDLARPAVLVSAGLLPRAAVDLDLTLDRIGRIESYGASAESLAGSEGSVLYVDAGLSAGRMDTDWLFVDQPTAPGVHIVPIASAGDRARLLTVEAAEAP
jgi:hypothetical protein